MKGSSQGHKWEGPLPKGWTDESRKKFWDSLTGRAPKHKVTACIKKMENTSIDNPGAFCASLADRVIPGWRKEVAKEKNKKEAFSLLKEAASQLTQPLRLQKDYGEKDQSEGSSLPGVDSLPMEEDPRVASPWVSLSEMEELCPPCAKRMKKAGISRIHKTALKMLFK